MRPLSEANHTNLLIFTETSYKIHNNFHSHPISPTPHSPFHKKCLSLPTVHKDNIVYERNERHPATGFPLEDITNVIPHLMRDLQWRQCSYSLMDRISDSGSDGCGSIPHGSTKQKCKLLSINNLYFFLFSKFAPQIILGIALIQYSHL